MPTTSIPSAATVSCGDCDKETAIAGGKRFKTGSNRNYAFVRSVRWDEPYHTSYELSEYIRAPQKSEPLLVAGENMQLYDWSMLDSVDVQPCQDITVESWWQLETEDDTPYTLNIILADDDGDGQLARTPSVPAKCIHKRLGSKEVLS